MVHSRYHPAAGGSNITADLLIILCSNVHFPSLRLPCFHGQGNLLLGKKELGLFKCASLFRKDGNTLVIDGGDILQGSPLGAFCHDTIGSAARFAEMMNRCGYDYVTLGNHDFNYGMPYLDSYLNVLKARCVCENVRWDEAGVRFPARIHTLENGLRVGIIGIVTDYVNIWEKPEHLAGIAITDPIPAVAAALATVSSSRWK